MDQQATELDRREALGAVAAGASLEVLGAVAPAVADRSSTIKITALRGFVVVPKAYLRIETNHRVFGWGEVTGLDPRVSVALAESLFQLLDGENPTRIEHLWQKIYRSHRYMRGGPFMV